MPILYPASNRFKYARSASDFRARRYAIQNPPEPEPAGYDPIQDFANGEQGFIYDIQDLSTLFQDVAGTIPAVVGLSVARINDKSGNGNHAIQVTPTSRAILRFVDGKYWIQTDGTDDWYITPTITPGTDKVQVFVGVRKLSDASGAILFEHSGGIANNTGSFNIWAPLTGTDGYSFNARGSASVNLTETVAGYPAPVTSVLAGMADIPASVRNLWIDGVLRYESILDLGTGNFLPYPGYLFRRGGLSFPFNGMISSMVCRYGPNLTTEQRSNMNNWTNDRTGGY